MPIPVLSAKEARANLKFLLSVSPVPLNATHSGQDAISANMYSKSVLRAAAEEFTVAHDNVNYFPSYEMVTLSNRANAYSYDNIHIQDSMVGRIVDRAVAKFVEGFEPEEKADNLAQFGDTPMTIYASAIEQRRMGNYDLAVRLFQIVVDANGVGDLPVSEAEFALTYGSTLEKGGCHAEAEQLFYKAVALAPRKAVSYYHLGLAAARLKRPHALQHFEEAALLDPQNAVYFWRLSEEYFHRGQVDRALETVGESQRLNPDLPSAVKSLVKFEAAAKRAAPAEAVGA